MICQSNNSCGIMPAADQGSWVLSAPAEKVEPSILRGPNGVQPGQPSNLPKNRLDGQNPRGYWLRQPPNLANLSAHRCAPAHARIRVRRSSYGFSVLQQNQQTGWEGREVGKPLLHKGFRRPTCFPTFSRLGYFSSTEVVEMSKGSLRGEMPTVTSIIDGFRDAFGKVYIDSIIRAGMRGQPVFYASENGHTIGTPLPPAAQAIEQTETHRERH